MEAVAVGPPEEETEVDLALVDGQVDSGVNDPADLAAAANVPEVLAAVAKDASVADATIAMALQISVVASDQAVIAHAVHRTVDQEVHADSKL